MNVRHAREIRAQVDRIAACAFFAESERLRRFLVFTTEATLSGNAASLKEYVLGREVFERDGDYDPRLDPIVRVEARRLRTKLAQYYDGPGRGERLRIDYPKGSYAPIFRPAPSSLSSVDFRKWGAACCDVGRSWRRGRASRRREPSTGYVRRTSGAVGQQQPFGHRSACRRLIASVDNRTCEPSNRAGHRVADRSREPAPDRPLRETAQRLGASRLLVLTAREDNGMDLVTIFDIDPATGQKVRALQYLKPVISPVEQRRLAERMASDLAQGLQATMK